MRTPSAWDDYFDALTAYLRAVEDCVANGGVATAPLRLSSRPAGPVPPEQAVRWRRLSTDVERLIAVAEQRRQEVSTLLGLLRHRQVPRRAGVLAIEM